MLRTSGESAPAAVSVNQAGRRRRAFRVALTAVGFGWAVVIVLMVIGFAIPPTRRTRRSPTRPRTSPPPRGPPQPRSRPRPRRPRVRLRSAGPLRSHTLRRFRYRSRPSRRRPERSSPTLPWPASQGPNAGRSVARNWPDKKAPTLASVECGLRRAWCRTSRLPGVRKLRLRRISATSPTSSLPTALRPAPGWRWRARS